MKKGHWDDRHKSKLINQKYFWRIKTMMGLKIWSTLMMKIAALPWNKEIIRNNSVIWNISTSWIF